MRVLLISRTFLFLGFSISTNEVVCSGEKYWEQPRKTHRGLVIFSWEEGVYFWGNCSAMFFYICWWPLGAFGVTCERTEGNQRVLSKGTLTIFVTFCWSIQDPSTSHFEHFVCNLFIFMDPCDVTWAQGEVGFKSSHRCDVQPLLETATIRH